MLADCEENQVLQAWRRLPSGELDRHDFDVLRRVVAGTPLVRESGLRGLEREQLVDDVVRRLWRSAVRQGPRWLDRARSNVNPEAAVRAYVGCVARSELTDRCRSWCGENTDLELPAAEPARSTLRDVVPVRLWADVLDPASFRNLEEAMEKRTLALLHPITSERDRSLVRFRVRCRLAAPSQLQALVTEYLAPVAAQPVSHPAPLTDVDLRRRRNALDQAMARLAKNLWSRLDDPSLRPSRRQSCRRTVLELFGAILGRCHEGNHVDDPCGAALDNRRVHAA